MGHITLGIADIEFVGSDFGPTDELELDEGDLVVLEERPVLRAVSGSRQAAHMPRSRRSVSLPAPSFDEMQTAVRAVGRLAHARR